MLQQNYKNVKPLTPSVMIMILLTDSSASQCVIAFQLERSIHQLSDQLASPNCAVKPFCPPVKLQ